jgi:hypothetical protein
MHMSEKTWKDPFAFKPERFLDSQNNVINADKILPFGIGKRVLDCYKYSYNSKYFDRGSFVRFFIVT